MIVFEKFTNVFLTVYIVHIFNLTQIVRTLLVKFLQGKFFNILLDYKIVMKILKFLFVMKKSLNL